MSVHEGRLRAMLDPDTGRGWNLNDEDRAAIQWLIDLSLKIMGERDQARHEFSTLANAQHERGKKIDAAVTELLRVVFS